MTARCVFTCASARGTARAPRDSTGTEADAPEAARKLSTAHVVLCVDIADAAKRIARAPVPARDVEETLGIARDTKRSTQGLSVVSPLRLVGEAEVNSALRAAPGDARSAIESNSGRRW